MKIDFITLFPEMFDGFLSTSIMKRAVENEHVDFSCIDFREYGIGRHRIVDDTPYGGGAGMLLKPEPIYAAVENLDRLPGVDPRIIMVDPIGEVFNQRLAQELAEEDHLVFICGHYEGFDERIRELATDHISIGDYVLTGGELPSMVMSDAIVRLLPEVLGNEGSAQFDSFSDDLLEHPHYTRPSEFRGMKVPEVLTSGNHALIEEWRDKESLRRTYLYRPDLLEGVELSGRQKTWLKEFEENE